MSKNNLQLIESSEGDIAINFWDNIYGDDVGLEFRNGKWLLSEYDEDKDEFVLVECDLIAQLKRIIMIEKARLK